ncbi:diaminopimelate epimerase [Kineosporia sp. J2-2]|uniref:Diaminopimelate epimerase n=1 Tax=Kineosporia corallincola TaxID=2835133 RepID=A0ABS5TDW6_9ACTN|nr:diaminopimelate epimerase [Kineosporia corallincola]MBT0769280.1 diaminopimelate epimerase [Kineosporia corallincola]
MTTFVKGHGTENDFVLLDDPDGRIDLTPELIRHLADRRAGLGADGVIRVVRSAAAGQDARAEWFMDYWNSDGSAAEMCGNGSRVFVAHLLRRGWIELDDDTEVLIATRGGVMPVRRRGDLYSIDLGGWQVEGGPAAIASGGDVKVTFPGMPPLPGLSIALSNPHVVVVLPDVATLEALDLTTPPVVEPAPPNGTNVEIVVPLHDQSIRADLGHLRMRVHERGSGETRSCGTGTVAAALAARAWGGNLAPDHWRVDVPGGTLYVDAQGTASEGDSAQLSGPAVIVAEGELIEPAQQG